MYLGISPRPLLQPERQPKASVLGYLLLLISTLSIVHPPIYQGGRDPERPESPRDQSPPVKSSNGKQWWEVGKEVRRSSGLWVWVLQQGQELLASTDLGFCSRKAQQQPNPRQSNCVPLSIPASFCSPSLQEGGSFWKLDICSHLIFLLLHHQPFQSLCSQFLY